MLKGLIIFIYLMFQLMVWMRAIMQMLYLLAQVLLHVKRLVWVYLPFLFMQEMKCYRLIKK